jgi:hypothetical protein
MLSKMSRSAVFLKTLYYPMRPHESSVVPQKYGPKVWDTGFKDDQHTL